MSQTPEQLSFVNSDSLPDDAFEANLTALRKAFKQLKGAKTKTKIVDTLNELLNETRFYVQAEALKGTNRNAQRKQRAIVQQDEMIKRAETKRLPPGVAGQAYRSKWLKPN